MIKMIQEILDIRNHKVQPEDKQVDILQKTKTYLKDGIRLLYMNIFINKV